MSNDDDVVLETKSFDNDEDLLCWAIKHGQNSVARMLILQGTRIDKVLCKCVDDNDVSMVELMLDQGANIHTENDRPLVLAASNGNVDIVNRLLDRGANIHGYDNDVLRSAAKNSRLKIVQLLLNRGANFSIRRKLRKLWGTCSTPSREEISKLCDELYKDNTFATQQFFFFACANNFDEMVSYFIHNFTHFIDATTITK